MPRRKLNIDYNRLKHLYEETITPVTEIAKEFDCGRDTIMNYIDKLGYIRSSTLKELSLKTVGKKNNLKRKNIYTDKPAKNNVGHWTNLPENERQIVVDKMRKSSANYWNNISLEDKKNRYEKHSADMTNYWNNLASYKKQQISNKVATKTSTYMNNLTETEKKQFKAKISKSQKERYALMTQEERNNLKGLFSSDRWNLMSEEEKQQFLTKAAVGRREYIDNMTPEDKAALRQSLSKAQQRRWNSLSEDEKDFERNKLRAVWNNRSYEEKSRIIAKGHNTKKNNGSYGKSKVEDKLFASLSRLTEVNRQVTSDKFSFDFFLPRLNAYVELNGLYFHNYRPFNNSLEHIEEYNTLMSKGGQRANIANKWRNVDVAKFNYCKDNNLNFIVVYFDPQFNNYTLNKVGYITNKDLSELMLDENLVYTYLSSKILGYKEGQYILTFNEILDDLLMIKEDCNA